MGAVAAGLLGFFIFLTIKLSAPQMTVLFADLAFEDSIDIVKRLEAQNVPHEIRQDGAVILVPKKDVLRLRMAFAEDGIPSGGVVGYEIFDRGNVLGATKFVQDINRLRALEGELARTIRALRRIRTARVKLVLPERKLFSRETPLPKASVVVDTRGTLTAGEIKAIRHLVASAVENLTPARVAIVDGKGRLLASGLGDDGAGALPTDAEERSRQFEARMRRKIAAIVASVVGEGRARVEVTAELDYTRITKTAELYDPDGQVVRSTQTRSERSSSTQPGDQTVTVGNELPSATGADGGATGAKEDRSKTSEIINYEISRTRKTEQVEGGRIKRLSVAVLVDGIYEKGPDGKLIYKPRSPKELEEIAALVRSAMGYDKARGDLLRVSNLRFAEHPDQLLPVAEDTGFFSFASLSKADYFRIAELTVLFLISLLMILFVIRPLVRRIVTPDETPDALAELEGDAAQGDGAGETGENAEEPLAITGPAAENATSDLIRLAKVTGEVQTQAIQEVAEIVRNNPEEAVSVIRQWLHEAA